MKRIIKNLFNIYILFIFCSNFSPESIEGSEIFSWKKNSYQTSRYLEPDAIFIADNIVNIQRDSGGWGKNINPQENISSDELIQDKLYASIFDNKNMIVYSHYCSTIDNGATYSQIRFLLRVAKATYEKRYINSVISGIRYLLSAQYPSGGWPQNYPNTSSYGGYVTFNDGAMVGVMLALKEASSGEYDFIDVSVRRDAERAFWRGIDYILKSQIVVDGVRGGWCAQHDPITYQPVRGRTYELPSISGAESVGIVKLLMDVDNPTPEIKNAIISAISWFKKNKILGFDYIKNYDLKYNHPVTITYREDPQAKIENTRTFSGRGYDNFLVFNKNSNPLWARFYDLKSQKPFFVGWDGVKKYDISEIDIERRTGYMWYGRWAESLLDHDWPKWKRKYCQNCFAED